MTQKQQRKKNTTSPQLTAKPLSNTKPVLLNIFVNKILLFIISIAVVIIFWTINNDWLSTKILFYWDDFLEHCSNLDIEYRKEQRFGSHYAFSKIIAEDIHKKVAGRDSSVLLLMPPTSYFTKGGVEYNIPEPAVFYYFTGMKTIWATSADAKKANWCIYATNGRAWTIPITTTLQLDSIIKVYNKLGY